MRYIDDLMYSYLQSTAVEIMKDEENVIDYSKGVGMVFVLNRLEQVPHDDNVRDFIEGDD